MPPAAIGTPAFPLPFVVPIPAEDASRTVCRLRDQREGLGPHASRLVLVVEESDTTLHLRLAGDFDRAGVKAVEHALRRVFEAAPPRRVVFDLRGLAFLDMAGLRTILRADAQGRAQAFEVVLVRPRGQAKRVFTLTRAGERLSIIDEQEAT